MDLQLKETILKYDRQVPRYTSYPTAPHFKEGALEGEIEGEYRQWLQHLPSDARLSLYLHVPFCPKMCWYCGCHTKITQRYAPVEDYTHLLMHEIAIMGEHIHTGQTISHLHFGGGSPSMLLPADFQKIMATLHKNFTFSDDAEIAMEIDPRGMTEEHIKMYAESGLNRASIGVQDFNQKVLESVNRAQPLALTENSVHLLRQNNVDNINFDFIYGLPHQTVETITETMMTAIDLEPTRISLFGYAYVPWMKKHMQLMDYDALPDNSLRYDLFETASEILTKNGFVSVGIDHFARPNDGLVVAQKNGTLRRNFQGYTTDTADAMIGIGSSSIGKFPQGFIQNSPHMPIYKQHILDGNLPAAKFCPLSKEDNLRAEVIEDLMTMLKSEVHTICKKHGFSSHHLDDCFAELQCYVADGLVSISEGVVTINPKARQIVRLVAAAFDAYLPKALDANAQQDTQRHSRAI